MTVSRPTVERLQATARSLHFDLPASEAEFLRAVMEQGFAAYDTLDGLPDNIPIVRRDHASPRRPDATEDPHNAWCVKMEVRGASSGKLFGRTVALKDNICLAGAPMMNGSTTLEGYVPEIDATVVTRILEAGGVIVGKTKCEHFCLSAGSHINPTGPTHNPYKRGYTTGGSSSGNAAAVAAGEADMALGGDQGGSIRVPASFCGLYGLKPTHGLVPYTGIMQVEMTLDHTGPMTRTVADNALLLGVIAGPDGLDPRQGASAMPADYSGAVERGVEGLRIGVLQEGFGHPGADAGVEAKVRAGAAHFASLGAIVENVSIPSHTHAPALWLAIAAEGLTHALMNGNVFGTGWKGLYVSSLRAAHARWRQQTEALSDPLKILMLFGQYMAEEHHGRFYAKAQNLSRSLQMDYNRALERYDLLLLPTSPVKARPIPLQEAPRIAQLFASASDALVNTSGFNVSGHPAMSVPCGMIDGLPVGLMLVARPFQETMIYRAAGAFEARMDWKSL